MSKRITSSKKSAKPRSSDEHLPAPAPAPSYNAITPATSATNEKALQGQTALQQYKFVPHRPPVLPGPSVLAEASENELYREVSKQWRTESQIANLDKNSRKSGVLVESDVSDTSVSEYNKNDPRYKTAKKKKKTSENPQPRNSSNTELDKKPNNPKSKDFSVNMCLVDSDMSKSFALCQKNNDESLDYLKKNAVNRDKSALPLLTPTSFLKTSRSPSFDSLEQHFREDLEASKKKNKEFSHRIVQCTIFGNSEKTFVIPPVINALLRALSFLLYEINREDIGPCGKGEMKTLMTQTQQALGDLCNQKIDREFNYDTTYSDSKRFEKIYEELKKLIEEYYGNNQEHNDKTEEMKKIFVEFKKKEMELALLNEKTKKGEEELVPELKDKDFKQLELTLQNKRLERDQLLAEVEFSKRDLINYQKSLAELCWDIKISQEQTVSLKKSLVSKSKTDMLGKKSSTLKFSNDTKRSKSRDSADGRKKKT